MAPNLRKVSKATAPSPKTIPVTNAEKCRLYRARLKDDPERCAAQKEKDLDRWKRNRQRPLTDEQIEIRREQGRLRAKKFRDKKKKVETKEVPFGSATPQPAGKKTRASLAAAAQKREKARLYKAEERKNWTSQKWRRHREKCCSYYQKKKEALGAKKGCENQPGTSANPMVVEHSGTLSTPVDLENAVQNDIFQTEMASPIFNDAAASDCLDLECDVPSTISNVPILSDVCTPVSGKCAGTRQVTKDSERKALYRAKSHLRNLTSGMAGKLIAFLKKNVGQGQPGEMLKSSSKASPSPKKVKMKLKEKLGELQNKRSKKSIVVRRLLKDIIYDGVSEEKNMYKQSGPRAFTEAAVQYLEDTAVDLPGKKSVLKRYQKQKKVLTQRLKTHHHHFLKENPDKHVSLRTFYRHLPKHIKTARHQTYRQCLCEVCTNFDLKLNALNPCLVEKIQSKEILSEQSLCKDLTLACLERKCPGCGIEKVTSSLKDSTIKRVQWKAWEMVKLDHGQRRQLVKKEGTVQDLLNQLLDELYPLSKHLFVYKWQHRQLKKLQADLPSTWAIAVCDFAENFLCKYQDEVQSAHWGYNQVTLHPTVLYYTCPDCASLVTDYQVFLSDDLKHDANFVEVVFERTAKYLQDIHDGRMEKMIVFSDGCSAHYKSKLPFYFLANQEKSVRIERHYFGSRHGKSSCDACGGVIKRLVDDDVLAGRVVIQSAEAMFDHCTGNYCLPPQNTSSSSPTACIHTKRMFHLIKPDDIDRTVKSSQVTTVPGTRQLHHAIALKKNILAYRNLSCFCPLCKNNQLDLCINSRLVNPLTIIKLKERIVTGRALEADKEAYGDENEADGEEEKETGEEENENDGEDIAGEEESEERDNEPQLLSEEREPRESYFHQLQQELVWCETFEDIEATIRRRPSSNYPLPTSYPQTIVDVKGTIDSAALQHKPFTVPEQYYPVQTEGDGNCLPRAVSILIFGNDRQHEEVRCRMIEELVLHRNEYQEGQGMGQNGMERSYVTKMLALTVESAALAIEESLAEVSEDDVEYALKEDIMLVRQPGTYMNLWQLAAAANISQRCLTSVYPSRGWEEYFKLNSRILRPRVESFPDPAYIMWTSDRKDVRDEHWVANHFVPLMPLSVPSLVSEVGLEAGGPISPVVGEFYMVKWHEVSYIARLDCVDDTGLVCLNFMMASQDGLYTWPLNEDISWEPANILQKSVQLELDPGKSNQRKQYYSVV